jgi:hypothetical protein
VATIGAWFALVLFWVLLVWSWVFDEMGHLGRGVFVALWVASNLVLRAWNASDVFPSIVALLDVILVLIVFKGDVRVT